MQNATFTKNAKEGHVNLTYDYRQDTTVTFPHGIRVGTDSRGPRAPKARQERENGGPK